MPAIAHPTPGDLVRVDHALEPEVYDVSAYVGRTGRIERIGGEFDAAPIRVRFSHGEDDFFHEELERLEDQ